MPDIGQFLREIWKRKVVQFGAIYLGAAWILLQVAVTLEDALELPNWVDQSVIVLLVVGFPLALILAWAQDTQAGNADRAVKDDETTSAQSDTVPTVVVLPFRNSASDEDGTITADGLTDDITTLLTRIGGLRVAPRQLVGGSSTDTLEIAETAKRFDANYVVTGAVRRSGRQLRVSAELMDLTDNQQVWSDRFDRDMEDLFAIQDEITRAVVGAIGGRIISVEGLRALRRPAESLQSWELTRRGIGAVNDWRKETLARGVKDLRLAIILDPDNAIAHAWLSAWLGWRTSFNWSEDADAERNEARRHAERAIALAETDAEVISVASLGFWTAGDIAQSVEVFERARVKDPDFFDVYPPTYFTIGPAFARVGREQEGLGYIEKFAELWPHHDLSVWQRVCLGYAEIANRNYARVAQVMADAPSEYAGLCHIIALVKLSRINEAKQTLEKWRAENPDLSLDYYIEHFKDYHIDRAVGAELSDALVELKDALAPKIAPTTKPAIAVLPFVNMSDEKDKEYFADGMTEDIITGLSLSGHLSVTSRTSMFAYKSQAADVRKVGEDLGATYVVEGSVRPMGDRLRITVQLIRAESGDHLWAEKFDRPASEIFDIQDEVIASITSAVGAIVTKTESLRASKLTPTSLSAWEAVQRASFYRGAVGNSEEETNKSIEELRAAVRDAPDYAYAHSMLAWISQYKVINGLTDTPEADAKEAQEHLEKGLSLAPDDSFNLNICSGAVGYMGQYDRSIELCNRALAIDPHFADPYFNLGMAYAFSGRFQEAEAALDAVERMAPSGPMSRYYDWYRAQLRQYEGRYEEAEPLIRATIEKAPGYTSPYVQLAIVVYFLGRRDEAKQVLDRVLQLNPKLTLARLAHSPVASDPDLAKRRAEALVEMWPESDEGRA